MDISAPSCGKCRWQKKASMPSAYRGGEVTIGLAVHGNGWPGISIGDHRFDALGAHYCEHPQQPRGLVLTNYSCHNFERPPEVDDQLVIDHQPTRLIP